MTEPGNGLFVLAQDAAATAETAAESGGMSGGALFLIVLACVILLPIVVGQLIANALKLKDFGFRISLCLFVTALGLAPFIWHAVNGRPMSTAIRQGIDLAGGTNMVFQVIETDEKKITPLIMDRMVAAVGRRINPSGTEEVTVRRVGKDRIEVIIPGADPATVREKKRMISRLGSLEFAILANQTDHADVLAAAKAMPTDEQDYRDATGRVIASWREVGEKDGVQKDVHTNGGGGVAWRDVEKVRVRSGQKQTVQVREFLVLLEETDRRVTGKYLSTVRETMDESGRPAVAFNFNRAGAQRFEILTRRNQPRRDGSQRRLAVLLDDRVHTAPSLEDVISESGIIRGQFSREEVSELINVLNAGALEVPIKPEPISEATVDPLLGQDVQEKGIRAIMIAGGAVVLFMLVYYHFAGFVAVLCLTLNLILVLGTMVLIHATFTLPGLAGLVLTIGMAVDANVLIFERIREEASRGSSLRMAIQNGFDRAFTTIVDANVTTLITAVILYMIGTDQVRGFAVTLFIGIVMSMFASLYFGRMIFELAERKRWIKKLGMLSIVGRTDWDFIGKRQIAFVVSVLLIIAGLATFFNRGTDNYDIDFTGGTMVTFQFEQDQETEAVKQQLAQTFGSAITLERLTLAGETAGTAGKHFRLRTRIRDADAGEGTENTASDGRSVRQMVNDAFASTAQFALKKIHMQFGDVHPVLAPPAAESDDAAADGENDNEADKPASNAGQEVLAHNVTLTFSDEVSSTTVLDNLTEAVATIQNETGGLKYNNPETLFEVKGTSGSGMGAAEGEVQKFDEVTVKALSALHPDDFKTTLGTMQSTMEANPHFDEVNSFASQVAREMKLSAVMAIIASLIAIVAYIWFRFDRVTFGLAAVAALVHDVLVVLGMVALASYLSNNAFGSALLLNDFKINLPMIAAFLTIVGYSLNDTIVVFDRIREVRGKNPRAHRRNGQPQPQPDAGPHTAHVDHHVSCRADSVRHRRRRHSRVCVLPGAGRDRGDLQFHLRSQPGPAVADEPPRHRNRPRWSSRSAATTTDRRGRVGFHLTLVCG